MGLEFNVGKDGWLVRMREISCLYLPSTKIIKNKLQSGIVQVSSASKLSVHE